MDVLWRWWCVWLADIILKIKQKQRSKGGTSPQQRRERRAVNQQVPTVIYCGTAARVEKHLKL